ncbi:MAG: GNAT family N-acetyltransferase [Paracoccaceae bacterium]
MPEAPLLARGPVQLVPFASGHLTDAYVGWLKDASVVRYSEQRHRSHSLESCRAFVDSFADSPNLLWAIEARDPDLRHIGNITVMRDPRYGLADIAILIGAEGCQGKGYGRRAWGLVLDHLRAQPDVRKITGGCMAANQAMVRIMEGAGMVPDGVRRAHYLLEGAPVDIVHFALWPEQAGRGRLA